LYEYNMGRTPRDAGPTIHNRLVVLRAERDLSRRQLAAAIGVNVQTIGYLERGDHSPSLELAFRLSELFDLPIESIFAREPFPPTSRQATIPRRQAAARRRRGSADATPAARPR
jgi:DNA-binding XRE family transcriptional regulator